MEERANAHGVMVGRGRVERERKSIRKRGGQRESPLAPLFICFFLPLGPVLCKFG